jgi:hypothetical protein
VCIELLLQSAFLKVYYSCHYFYFVVLQLSWTACVKVHLMIDRSLELAYDEVLSLKL